MYQTYYEASSRTMIPFSMQERGCLVCCNMQSGECDVAFTSLAKYCRLCKRPIENSIKKIKEK